MTTDNGHIAHLYAVEAAALYAVNAQGRKYHSLEHARKVLSLVLAVVKGTANAFPASQVDALALAALWHDAVYVVGSPHNEELSAQELQHAADSSVPVRLTAEIQKSVDLAKWLIRRTTVGHHLAYAGLQEDDTLEAVLRDADLASGMFSSYEKFVDTQDSLVAENGGDKAKDRHKCAAFLTKFLVARPFIFGTGYGRRVWEATVRDNLVRYIVQQP